MTTYKQIRPYQRCTRCVMDTTDSKITFDENGVCDHCRNFDTRIKPFWKPQENRFDELEELAKKIRKAGEGHDYDCILGLSGGADSCYLAYIAKEEAAGRLFVFRPSQDIGVSAMEKDPGRLKAVYQVGMRDAKRQLAALKEFLQD